MKSKIILAALLYLALLLVQHSCHQSSKSEQEETSNEHNNTEAGVADDSLKIAKMNATGVQMITIGSKYKVWTRRIGGESTIKVLVLHGGPALTHEYLECFEDYFPQSGIQLIEYDQLGSYYSDQPADSALWTVARFVEEVEEVRQELGLT